MSGLRRLVALAVAALLVACGGAGEEGEGDDPVGGQQLADEFPVEREVEWRGGSGTAIGATLTLPAKNRPMVAAVVIVPGFGAIDRNAVMSDTVPDRSADRLAQELNLSRPGSPDKLLEDVADVLAEAGMASVRYDKRGSARSQLKPGQALSYDDVVADARAGLDFLNQRRETSAVPKAVVGHDQGGLVALRLAAGGGVRSVVLVSTFGRPLADLVADDFVAARGDGGRPIADQLRGAAAELVAGRPLPPPEALSSHIHPVLVPEQESYLRALFSLDPVAEARAARVPALVVRGERDRSINETDTRLLRSGLTAASEEHLVPGADHNLVTEAGGRRDTRILGPVPAWIAAHTGG